MSVIHGIIALLRGANQVSKSDYQPLIKTKTLFKLIAVLGFIILSVNVYSTGRLETAIFGYGILCVITFIPLLIIRVISGYKIAWKLPKEERVDFLKKRSKENNRYVLKLIAVAVVGFIALLGFMFTLVKISSN